MTLTREDGDMGYGSCSRGSEKCSNFGMPFGALIIFFKFRITFSPPAFLFHWEFVL